MRLTRSPTGVISTLAPPPAAPPIAPAAEAIRGTSDTPVVVASTNPAPAMVSQFPDPKPVRTVLLRPDGTPIPASEAPPASSAPAAAAPANAASKANEAAGT